jgi:predicted nucleic acid-binding protein
MRIFLDANILFSAAKSDGAIRLLLALLARAGQVCCADGYVIEEARRNLAAEAPGGLADLEIILRGVEVTSAHPADSAGTRELPLPEKDRPVLAAAIRLGCEALVTGDSTHFGPLFGGTIHGVTIYTPRSLAEKILK